MSVAVGHRIYSGQIIVIQTASSTTDPIEVRGRVEYDSGGNAPFAVPITPVADRVPQVAVTIFRPTGIGTITQLNVFSRTARKRGQTLAIVAVQDVSGDAGQDVLCMGYVRDFFNLTLGVYENPGPGGGEGFLSWLAVAADVAPVDIATSLAATNALRKIHGFVWSYNASADAATRTATAKLEQRGPALPTGFATLTSASVWNSGTLTLTLSEEGVIYAMGSGGDGLAVVDDNGTLAIDSTATAPQPFPIWVTEDDITRIEFDVGAPHANDRHNLYILVEEWLVI